MYGNRQTKKICGRQRNFNNFNNLIYLTSSSSQFTYAAAYNFAPRIMLSNTMSLVPKLAEIQEFLLRKRVDIGLITETWLNDNISDSIVHIDGYNLHRKDRLVKQHGGVCIYLRDGIMFEIPENLNCCQDHEIYWLKLIPKRLPRGFSCLIVAVVYHPPGVDSQLITNHLFQSLSAAESTFPNCGLIVAGDFNHLNVDSLQRHFNLKQLVKSPTRGQATLDLILTNMAKFFSQPEINPPFGLSDHSTVLLNPKKRTPAMSIRKQIFVRDKRQSKKDSLARYFASLNWPLLMDQKDCEGMLSVFEEIVKIGMNNIMPIKSIKVYPKDAPWMTIKLKELIRLRQLAFHSNKDGSEYKTLRNQVNRERKVSKAKFYSSKVEDLKGKNPKQWWKEVNRLSGATKTDSGDLLNKLQTIPELQDMPRRDIANKLNAVFLEPLQVFHLLDPTTVCVPLENNPDILQLPVYRVYKSLTRLNKHKSCGPDGISNWLLKEYAENLAEPITHIMNASFKEQKIPGNWKLADITPIPKVKKVSDPSKELRPISLTSSISKIAEDFVVTDYIKPSVIRLLDPNQFGTVPGSSTTMALISMLHKWLGDTDGTGDTVRVMFYDFRKAFDFIDHSLLMTKLNQLNIPNSIFNWIVNFITGRSQRVKMGCDCFSDWGAVRSGVPQGTKLGPWLFLIMINDLSIATSNPFDLWKYVDDSTVSETIRKGEQSCAQSAANEINEWSKENLFQLNCDKTKELVINYSRQNIEEICPPVLIDGQPIRKVTSVKLLGLTLNSHLTWNNHVEYLVKSAFQKLYFLIQLKRSGVDVADIVQYYCACIRSTLDYACPVFHYALPTYLREDLERIQKRALRCIFPGVPYSTALELANIQSIDDHHEALTNKLFQNIKESPDSKLQHLLRERHEPKIYDLRVQNPLVVPRTKTKRFSNSFIIAGSKAYNQSHK